MDKTQTWTVINRVKQFAPDEYKQQALEYAKRQAGNELYAILEQSKNPTVVKIDEKITQARDMPKTNYPPFYTTDDVIEIQISVTPVQYRDVVIQKGLEFDPTIYISRPTFIRRLKYAITGK